jgi:hypothetical protein
LTRNTRFLRFDKTLGDDYARILSIFERMLHEAFSAQPVMTHRVRVRSLAVFALAKTEEPALACLKSPAASGVRTNRKIVYHFGSNLIWVSSVKAYAIKTRRGIRTFV